MSPRAGACPQDALGPQQGLALALGCEQWRLHVQETWALSLTRQPGGRGTQVWAGRCGRFHPAPHPTPWRSCHCFSKRGDLEPPRMAEVSLSLGLSSSVRGSERFIGQHPRRQPSLPTVAQRAASRGGSRNKNE